MTEKFNEQNTGEKYFEGQVLDESQKKINELSYAGDAVKEAIEKEYVKEISEGQWIYLAEATKIVKNLQNLLRENVAGKLNYQEWIFPRLQRVESIANFGWEMRDNLRGELMKVVPNIIERGRHLPDYYYLDPLQCPSFYRYLSKVCPLDSAKTPIKVYEVLGGWTYRNEKPERISTGFQTGLEFIGAELVFLGKPGDVVQVRKDTLNHVLELLDRLGIVWRTVVGSSCCHGDSQKYGAILEKGCNVNEIPTIDIECYIPHRNEWIEIGGGDLAFDRLASKFGINFENSNEEIWSGCQGFGFGRAVYIFLSQFGFDQSKWPTEISKSTM